MRHFAQHSALRALRCVLRPDASLPNLLAACERAVREWQCEALRICEPGEHRLMAHMVEWSDALGLPMRLLEDTRFILPQRFFELGRGRKQLRMSISIARCASVMGF